MTVQINGVDRQATSTAKGIIELATDAETQTGTDTERAVTPANLTARSSTESRTGIVELATTAEAVAGSDTARGVTPAGNAASEAVIKNPLAFAQGVSMTYASSGSTGIQVADDDDIDFGTGNFTLVWKGNLPDWTPSVSMSLISKDGGAGNYGYIFTVSSAKVSFTIRSQAQYDSTLTNSLFDGTVHMMVAVVTRETAAIDGSVLFYIDGYKFGDTVAIPAGTPRTVTSTASLFISGTGSVRGDSTTHFAATYNRALSAAEVLDLYRNGINAADKWGSQVSIITGNDSTFAGASNWANVDINAYDETDDLTITASAVGQYCTLPVANATMVSGKKYRLVYDVANLVSTWTIKDFGGTQTIDTIDAVGTGQSIEFTASTSGGLRIVADAADSSADIDNVYLYEIGATLALEQEGIQPNPGQWLDSSSNNLHAMQPAAGSSLIRGKKEFEIRWTNTWAATHEAQYIGGLNQAILPTNCYITNIIGVVSGATIEDIIIGDGSDTDRWVTITTGLAAGTVAFTIANPISDGTNYKMVVDPDANFTGSISWLIKGVIL